MGACKSSSVADSQSVSEAEIHKMLKQHGIDDERVRNGLHVAFDLDDSGTIDRKEYNRMCSHLKKLKQQNTRQPYDLNAWISLGSRSGKSYENAGNAKLKMFFTSAGLTPQSTPGQIEAFKKLKNRAPGNGVIYVLDARLVTLQFHLLHADPKKCNDEVHVAYVRKPDAPGGEPQYDADGKLILKGHKELNESGDEYAAAHWTLRNNGSYGNVHLSILTENVDETPIWVSYLAFDGEWVDDKPQYKILVGRGVMRGGKFVAFRTDGEEFTEEDYERPCDYEAHEDFFFKETSGEDFAQIVQSVQVIHGLGGIPVIPILHFQPHFIRDGHDTKHDNPYGKAILDTLKSGNATYIGMSAGSMVWSWCIGPLTTDPDDLHVMGADGQAHKISLGPSKSLGKFWLFPGLGQYVGVPHDISLKAHKRFDPATCSYVGNNAKKAENVGHVVSALCEKSKFCALLCDYNWGAGHGDCLEIADSKIFYHVGFSKEEKTVQEDLKPRLNELGHQADTMRMQPHGNPEEGWSFEWSPKDGEVICAGPKASKPFHSYASAAGLLDDHPPSYSKSA